MKFFHYLLLFSLLLFSAMDTIAQEDNAEEKEDFFSHTIDSARAFSPAYLPTSYTFCGTTFFRPIDYQPIDTTLHFIGQYDVLNQTDHIYQTLGIYGQAHKPINFTYQQDPGFSFISNPYPLYVKKQSDLQYYKLDAAYTNLNFAYSFLNEYDLYVTHAQNIKDKVYLAANLRGYSCEGYFTHQATKGVSLDALIHYETPKHYYGIKASYILNFLDLQENGGLLNTADFLHQKKLSPLQGYNMSLYYATSKWLSHDMMLQQYINFLSNNKKQNKKTYWGTLMHTLQYKRNRINFNDSDADSIMYENFFYSTDSTRDLLKYYILTNTIQWSSFRPWQEDSSKRFFFHFTGGISHEYVHFFDSSYKKNNAFIPFAQVHIRLFSRLDIQAKIAYTLHGLQKNDVNFYVNGRLAINQKKKHFIGGGIDFYYRTPNYYMFKYEANNICWDTIWGKQKIMHANLLWERLGYLVEFNYYYLDKYVYFNSESLLQTIAKPANIFQVHFLAPIYIKGFGLRLNMYVQLTDSKEIHLPIFAGKADIFYHFFVFRKKAQIQVGANLAYNTAYYADGYSPLIHQFYSQTKQKVGNYVFFDPYIAFRVQRISIYFKVTHALCGLMGFNYFTTVDYPMQSRRFTLGITWRFFD